MTGWFDVVPRASCAVEGTEVGLIACYFPPATDGSRGGTPFFLNTSDSAAWGRFELEAMAFHEGVPEHHLQGSIADELPASGQDADDGDQQEQLEARKVDAVGGGAWVARCRVWLRDRAIDS